MKYNKFSVIAVLAILYFIPLVLISIYGLQVLPIGKNWPIFIAGLLISICGTGVLFFLICHWEFILLDHAMTQNSLVIKNLKDETHNVSQEGGAQLLEAQSKLEEFTADNQHLKSQIASLQEQIEHKANEIEIHKSAYRQYRQEAEAEIENLTFYKSSTAEELQDKDKILSKLEALITQQKKTIESLHHELTSLHSKEEELNYEIKTLLQVSRMDHSEKNQMDEHFSSASLLHDVSEPLEIDEFLEDKEEEQGADEIEEEQPQKNNGFSDRPGSVLRYCLEAASKMNGVGNSRSSTLPVENYVLDMRRLCDQLRIETKNGILLYSQKESKLLFANSCVKELLGWPSDKFIQIFPEIIQPGFSEWRKGIQALSENSKINLHLSMKSKDGHPTLINCYLGGIDTGIFRNHLIAVLSRDME